MKFLICAAVLVIVSCGVVPQEQLEPVGGARDLISTEQRLYAQKVADDAYCVLLEDKSGKTIELLTEDGALSERQLRKWLLYGPDWLFVLTPSFLYDISNYPAREERLAALQVRDVHIALPTKRFNKIVTRIKTAEPKAGATSCARFKSSLKR